MRIGPILLVIVISVSIFSCQSNESQEAVNPLTGVWELASAEWRMQDTTMVFPDPDLSLKSTKYYSKTHFFVIGKGEEVYSLSGTYSIDGNKCIEVIGLTSTGMSPGDKVEITFAIEEDMLSLESDWFTETWKRLE